MDNRHELLKKAQEIRFIAARLRRLAHGADQELLLRRAVELEADARNLEGQAAQNASSTVPMAAGSTPMQQQQVQQQQGRDAESELGGPKDSKKANREQLLRAAREIRETAAGLRKLAQTLSLKKDHERLMGQASELDEEAQRLEWQAAEGQNTAEHKSGGRPR